MKINSLFFISLCLLLNTVSTAIHALPSPLPKSIALTIDDLPFVGEARNFHLNMMISTLKKAQIPATGFIIAHEVSKANWKTLYKFRNEGLGLGNHTYTHANLNKVSVEQYIQEIKKADTILAQVLTQPKYFRYPYLAMSSGIKKNKILCYLAKHNYEVAPITIDSKDFLFNQRLYSVPESARREYLEELKPLYLDYIWQQTLLAEASTNKQQAQILLIHANLLNAYVLPDIINLYQKKGYSFISLESALATFKKPVRCLNPKNISKSKAEINLNLAKNDFDIESFIDWD